MFGKFFVWLFVAQLAVSASPPTGSPKAPPPKLLLQIRVLPQTYAILTLAFSPDEHWIAILGEPQTHALSNYESDLLLVPTPPPTAAIENRPLEHPVPIDTGRPIFWGPVWAPRSDAVLVGELPELTRGVAKLFSIRGDQLWARDAPQSPIPSARPGGQVFGFLDSDHLIAELLRKHKPAAFATLDLHGELTDTWPVPKKWTIAAVSPHRRLLAVYSDDYRSKTLIIDYPSRRIVQSKKNPTWLYRDGIRALINAEFFTETGGTLCAVGGRTDEARPAECWSVDTGKTIGQFRGVFGGAPAAASAHASRIVLTQVRTSFRPEIDYFGDCVVWDYRSGIEVAEWPAAGQAAGGGGVIQPASVAISATGRYVAEGADGMLRVYELP